MDEQQQRSDDAWVGAGYAYAQLAKAFVTSLTDADPQVRERAEGRLRRWELVLSGIVSGRLTVGSRRPVRDWPAWVTPEVLRGGFATGTPVAAGALTADERAWAEAAGLPLRRDALFAYFLTEDGLAELAGLLESGRYRVGVPEEAALLTVAWLVGAGDQPGARRVVEEIRPFADRLRFLPARTTGPVRGTQVVWRETARDVRDALGRRGRNLRVEAMREAVRVWAPFADDVLALWLDTRQDGRVAAVFPPGWREQASALLRRYEALSREHTLCSKHRRPKENLAIMLAALRVAAQGRNLAPRQRGMLQHAVDAAAAKRGESGSDLLAGARARQVEQVAAPTHHALAQLVVRRLSDLPEEAWADDLSGLEPDQVDSLVAPVRPGESSAELPEGTPVPPSVVRVVSRATAGTVEDLVASGVVGSAEVLASLIPQLAASVVGAGYADPHAGVLAAETYRAFRSRRTLLLLDVAKQVQVHELPWAAALARHVTGGGDAASQARAQARRFAELTVQAFPATLPPNRLVRELDALSRQCGLELPWVEELAADIFMGTFSAKFTAAATVAAELLADSLYARYYGIDYAAVLALHQSGKPTRVTDSGGFAALCAARAGAVPGRWGSVAENGTVIEQAQILTTHNLAAMLRLGIRPRTGWRDLAERAFAATGKQLARAVGNPRPLSTVKDAAYAWRHTVFFLTQVPPAELRDFLTHAGTAAQRHDPLTAARLAVILGGLASLLDRSGAADPPEVQPFLGWTTTRHWLLAETLQPGRASS